MKSWPTSRAAATPWLIMTMVFTTYIALSNRTPSRRRLILSRPIAAARATPLPGAAGAGRTTATSARTLRATCRRPSGRPPAPTTGTPRRPAIRSWIMLHLPGKPWKATTFRAPQLRRSPASAKTPLPSRPSIPSRTSAAARATPSPLRHRRLRHFGRPRRFGGRRGVRFRRSLGISLKGSLRDVPLLRPRLPIKLFI